MMRGMFAAIAGLKVHQTMLDVTANDIANVNTVGFKSERVTFKDSLSQTIRNAGAPGGSLGGTNASQIGLGVQIGSIDNEMGSGAIQTTGNQTDMAVQGDGYFRVTNNPSAIGPANTFYTRAGNFSRDANGDLVTSDGYYVLGNTQALAAGTDGKINIPSDATSVSIDPKGVVTVVTPTATTDLVHHARQVPERPGPRA